MPKRKLKANAHFACIKPLTMSPQARKSDPLEAKGSKDSAASFGVGREGVPVCVIVCVRSTRTKYNSWCGPLSGLPSPLPPPFPLFVTVVEITREVGNLTGTAGFNTG